MSNSTERFWSKVDKSGECWIWTASRDRDGYGKFGVRGKLVGAHRHAFEAAKGVIPKGLCVLHKCDNPACCNPAHLWLGTKADNNADREAKGRGRQPRGARHGRYTRPESTARGERSGGAKLTEDQVREIRSLYATDSISKKGLGRRFGVSPKTIRNIVLIRKWKQTNAEAAK